MYLVYVWALDWELYMCYCWRRVFAQKFYQRTKWLIWLLLQYGTLQKHGMNKNTYIHASCMNKPCDFWYLYFEILLHVRDVIVIKRIVFNTYWNCTFLIIVLYYAPNANLKYLYYYQFRTHDSSVQLRTE